MSETSGAQQKIPNWVLNGNVIPVSFEGTKFIEGALVCPRCSSTNISMNQIFLKTVPDRDVNGIRIGFMCYSCESAKKARNPALVLDVINENGKCYCKWEK